MKRAASLIFLLAPLALAQQSQPAKPAEPPAPAKKEPDPIPDLDSLLGTKEDKQPAKTDTVDPAKKELEHQLSLKEQADEFSKIVQMMDETADRVQKQSDAGLATQRAQEDILIRLDRLIKAAEQNSSSSKSQQQQQQDKDKEKNKNMRQQSQAQSKQSKSSDPQNQADGPSREDAALGTPPAAPPASWGDLPAHVRDALLQGFSDKFSSMYQSMTESYYRKLADEKKK